MDLQAIKTLKSDIPGNNRCVDCDALSKCDLIDFLFYHSFLPFFFYEIKSNHLI